MKRNVVVQGIGCAETGARVVLRELLDHVEPGRRYWVVCTSVTAQQFIGKSLGWMGSQVFLIGLSHQVFGRWLRLPLEATLALLGWARLVDGIVNLSHYGWCLAGRYSLYIHSPLLMDRGAGKGWKDGNPNRIKRSLLNSCLRRATTIVLQTPQMAEQLESYCTQLGIAPPKYRVMRPQIEMPADIVATKQHHQVQLFYPTSRFAHKRADLAIAGACRAAQLDSRVGLVITVPKAQDKDSNAITYLGPISRQEVWGWLKASDAMLFTSERETLGLPLLEALRAHVPVIAPRLPYAVEILGTAGTYFDEPTTEGVASAVLEFLSHQDERKELTRRRALEVEAESAPWAEHWKVLLDRFPSVAASVRKTAQTIY